jgi:thiol:disulfide interchange protein
MPKPIIHGISSLAEFRNILNSNQGKVVIKFGAEWCAPCKMIESQVHQYFSKMPDFVQCYIVDVDQSIELYAFLKSKKMITGIPALLCYNAGNVDPYPDLITIGADPKKLEHFFQSVMHS